MNRLKWIAPLLVGLISVLPVAAQSPAKLREWIASHIEDLPNFVCDYTEKQYGAGRWNYWSLKSEHSGEVRYVDGNDEYRVLLIDGVAAEAPIWKLTNWHNPFAGVRHILRPAANYRFTPKGRDKFNFLSDLGGGLFKEYTEDGKPGPGRSYPTWGTIWIDKQTHAVQKIKERFKVPRGDPMFQHGEREIVTEYDPVSIGEKTYTLLAKAKFETKEARDRYVGMFNPTPHWRTVRMYENCRRFQVDSSIQYGDMAAAELPESGPTSTVPTVDATTGGLPGGAAFDGHRDGASRMDTPSLENKGESNLDIERIPVADQSAQAGDLARLRRWIASYLKDLPNFVCDYEEIRSELFMGDWVRMDSNEGQVRYIDGKSDYLVETESGIPTNKRIWEVTSGSPDSFASMRGFLEPSQNYQFAPTGEGQFSFQSDVGIQLVRGFTKDGRPKGGKSYPSWGTLWADGPSHAIRSFIEYIKVPKRGTFASFFTSGFLPGEHSWLREFGTVKIGEKSYWLPKREELIFNPSDRNHDPERVVQTYDNCRRFQVGSSIRYGDIAASELPASGPTSSPAPKPPGPDISKPPGVHPTAATTTTSGTGATGGTGDELGTTTLEVGVDLDSARSPNIPPQAPPAAPQPPLSKAVRTSPKRNAPSEDRDPLSRYGYDQSSPSSTKEKDDLFEGDLISRYGYHEEPPSSEEDRPLLKRYGYYAYSDSLPPPEEEEDEQVSIDRSAFWWFSMGGIVAGIVAFAAAFVGSFFGNSLRRHRG